MVKITCPCKSKHKKKVKDVVVLDNHCGSLLGFIKLVQGAKTVFKCRSCKGITQAEVDGSIVYLKILPSKEKIKCSTGKVIIDVV